MPPPAANGTIRVIGRVGQSCAAAGASGRQRPAPRRPAPFVVLSSHSPQVSLRSYCSVDAVDAARLDRHGPALDLGRDELGQIFRRAPILRGDDDADRLEALAHRRRVDGVARRLGRAAARSPPACPSGTRMRPRRRSRGPSSRVRPRSAVFEPGRAVEAERGIGFDGAALDLRHRGRNLLGHEVDAAGDQVLHRRDRRRDRARA